MVFITINSDIKKACECEVGAAACAEAVLNADKLK
jgi:hypothetical protein